MKLSSAHIRAEVPNWQTIEYKGGGVLGGAHHRSQEIKNFNHRSQEIRIPTSQIPPSIDGKQMHGKDVRYRSIFFNNLHMRLCGRESFLLFFLQG